MTRQVLVTGGTGKTGTRLVRLLRDAGASPRAASRSGTGEGAIRFDWEDRNSWEAAIEGVDAAYLVAPAIAGDPGPLMIEFAELASSRGVRRLVLLSGSPLPAGGPGMGQVHQWLIDHGQEWAVLRPSWFMENFSEAQHLPTILHESKIYSATDDGRVPFISAQDIAASACAALTAAEAPNRDYILTGGDLLTYDQVATRIGAAVGREIVHQRLSVSDLAARYTSLGLGEMAAQMLAGMDALIASGAEDRVTADVKALTGKDPLSFDGFVAENTSAWRA